MGKHLGSTHFAHASIACLSFLIIMRSLAVAFIVSPHLATSDCTGGSLGACRAACPSETSSWDGDFLQFRDGGSFCGCGFGGSCPYICAGGGASGGGGGCDPTACSSGQYKFDDEGWTITVTQSEGKGASPYRAFAYLPFCGGSDMACFGSDFDIAFTFKTEDLAKVSAYVKMLFWTDGFDILGLLPPAAPGAQGSSAYRLIAFPTTDYPNAWAGEYEIEDGKWYDVKVSFSGSSATVTIGGQSWTDATFGDVRATGGNGAQLGAYNFDFGSQWKADSYKISLGSIRGPTGLPEKYSCDSTCLDECKGDDLPASTPSGGHCCWAGACGSHADCHVDAYCSASVSQCTGNCGGTWCTQADTLV